jgi:hypothetical protein
MAGGASNRFCTACNRSVYDMSVLTRRQAADLLDNNAGKVCGRISYDERGDQIFAKERNAIERLLQISVLGASAVASAAAAPNCEVKVRVVDPMGDVTPEATVKIARAAGAEEVSSGASNDRGEFSGRIAPGICSVQVEYGGHMSFEQKLTCKAAETVSIKAPLRLAPMGEVVEVKSEGSPLLRKLRSLFRRL